MAQVKFMERRSEIMLVSEIVERAIADGLPVDRMSLAMDIEAVHSNGNPLRLAGLLKARPFDFTHDILGI